jgi:hypothetical protein
VLAVILVYREQVCVYMLLFTVGGRLVLAVILVYREQVCVYMLLFTV